MIEANIEISRSDIKEIKRRLGAFEDKTPDVLSRAINRTVASIKTELKREVAKHYRIAQKDVAVTHNDKKATSKQLYGCVESKGTVIPLLKFSVSPMRTVTYNDYGEPNPSHYSAAVFKGHGLIPLDHNPKAFVAIMSNGHGGIFERTGRWKSERHSKQTREANRGPNERAHSKHNEIIKELMGPSVPQIIKNKDVIATIRDKAESTLHKRIDAEINYILSKGAAKNDGA